MLKPVADVATVIDAIWDCMNDVNHGEKYF